ncbi:MAG: hypothetical protein CM1200mP10_26280 [Candidatus Neomarinimicrobiota bacterium]|nr:MAG: hypothetical protein CM1200mP10_26280 [Candidatus Neomarinimicrobiota bacterium]
MYGDTVTIEGIVTMPTGLSFAGERSKNLFSRMNMVDRGVPFYHMIRIVLHSQSSLKEIVSNVQDMSMNIQLAQRI